MRLKFVVLLSLVFVLLVYSMMLVSALVDCSCLPISVGVKFLTKSGICPRVDFSYSAVGLVLSRKDINSCWYTGGKYIGGSGEPFRLYRNGNDWIFEIMGLMGPDSDTIGCGMSTYKSVDGELPPSGTKLHISNPSYLTADVELTYGGSGNICGEICDGKDNDGNGICFDGTNIGKKCTVGKLDCGGGYCRKVDEYFDKDGDKYTECGSWDGFKFIDLTKDIKYKVGDKYYNAVYADPDDDPDDDPDFCKEITRSDCPGAEWPLSEEFRKQNPTIEPPKRYHAICAKCITPITMEICDGVDNNGKGFCEGGAGRKECRVKKSDFVNEAGGYSVACDFGENNYGPMGAKDMVDASGKTVKAGFCVMVDDAINLDMPAENTDPDIVGLEQCVLSGDLDK